jgi:hypothetical protein
LGIQENEAIVEFLYRVTAQGNLYQVMKRYLVVDLTRLDKNFRIRFAPNRGR